MLAGHALSFAGTLAKAEQLLGTQTFDLIVCTIVSDESRMLEFLRLAKSQAAWREIPFVCARVRPHVIPSAFAVEAVEFTSRTLGAAAFLDVENYRVNPERELRIAIEGLLPSP